MKMPLLPEEIITEILIQLPARELRRLRCVSKSWRALIDSSIFINMHLNNSIQTNSNQTLVLFNGMDTFCLHVENLFDDNGNRKSNFPLKLFPRSVVFASCRGLLLICKGYSIEEGNCPYHGNGMNDFGIWNPNTGEYKSLPDPLQLYQDFPSEYNASHVYGFGFDSTKDEYKVVRMTCFLGLDELKDRCQADIYSSKSNSWRRIESVSLLLNVYFYQTNGAFASDAVHWAGRAPRGGWEIFAFDIGTEELRVVAHPDFSINIHWIRMEELNGKLCLSSARENNYIDLWIMKDYGVRESWIKLLSISSPENDPWCYMLAGYSDFPYIRPLACSSLGDKMVLSQCKGKLILYDLARNIREEIRIGEQHGLLVAYSCVDSVVRLSNYDTTASKSQNRHA